ncbi:MAG: MOSC domain-containing protein [Candidatus Eiseniibacteriota bacterium]
MTISVVDICRYPVKGLNAESLDAVALEPDRRVPHDRRFALAPAASRFQATEPAWLPKSEFVTLLRAERLALLRARFEPATGHLTIERAGKQVARARATESVGRTILEQFFSAFFSAEAQGAVRLAEGDGFGYTDQSSPFVSIVNLASVRDLERVIGGPVDPLRFRANLYIDGAAPWAEFGWIDRALAIGGARLAVAKRNKRCGATNVDPATAERDLNILLALERGFGHTDMGVYARVTAGGGIARGEDVIVA